MLFQFLYDVLSFAEHKRNVLKNFHLWYKLYNLHEEEQNEVIIHK